MAWWGSSGVYGRLRGRIADNAPTSDETTSVEAPRSAWGETVIAKAGPSDLSMGYSAMGISFLYSILIILFVLFSAASR